MNAQHTHSIGSLLVIALTAMPLPALSQPGHVKLFGLGAPFQIEDLPPGHVREKLHSLPAKAQQKALNKLHGFAFTEQDLDYLQIDNQGDVLYSDTYVPDEVTADTSSTSLQPEAITAIDAFGLHSKPGAKNIIYLDFNGHTISGTAWNGSTGVPTLKAKAFTTDTDITTFSSTELGQIAEIWHRIAEDYAPFNVDVTTQEPTSFGPTVGRILITHSIDSNGKKMPSSTAGGVAYVNVWGASNYASYYSPALIYYNNLGSGFPPYVAEAASHEMGHNLGLAHDGYKNGTTSTGYYSGNGTGFVSWAPIMGLGYYNNVTEWSKGEYAFATQFQDDLNLISTKLTYRTDDHGNTSATPTPLFIDATGKILASNPETDPHNTSPENKGIIETRNDVDFFFFNAGSGVINITVTPAWDAFYRSSRRGANLDIEATLYAANGVQIGLPNDPATETYASLSATVPAGQYMLAVKGVGNTSSPYSDYGSLGQYFITGTVPVPTSTDNTPPAPNPMAWAVAPNAGSSTNSIFMQASAVSDASGSVQYNFVCVAGGGSCVDGGWQASNQYTASGLQAGTSYSYHVRARDSYGNLTEFSTSTSATTAASLPSAPANLTSEKNITAKTVTLNWAIVNDASTYEVWRCTQVTVKRKTTCSYGTSAYATSTINSFSELLPSSTVRYKVRAINSSGASGLSNEVTVTP